MATIKFKRGSGQPAGLTAYEPAWDTTNNRFFINNGSTALWVGAKIENDINLGGAGSSGFVIPTQFAVKTYVDNVVAGGAVASINGLTGAVTGVAFLGTAQTFTQLQSFSAGISAAGGVTFRNGINVNVSGTELISNSADTLRLGYGSGSNVYIGNQASPNNFIEVTEDSITIKSANPIVGNLVGSVNGATGAVTAVSSLNGVTGIVNLNVGSALSIVSSPSAKGITLSNTGVWAIQAGAGLSSSGQTGNVTLTNTGVLTNIAGTGIAVSGAAGNVTITNIGVQSIAGTSNQITASGSTGAVTLSLPSAVTMPGSLTVTGDLTVNGTTTTVNSTTVTIQDPIIAIGGVTGNAAPPTGDTKDRGIVFQWNNGSAGQTGFFGFDRSTQRFTYLPTGVAVSAEIVSGNAGNAEFSGIYAPQGTLTLQGVSASSAQIVLEGNTSVNSTLITNTAKRHIFKNGNLSGEECQIEIGSGSLQTPEVYTILKSNAGLLTNSNKTITLPDFSGGLLVAATSGATSGWVVRGAGASSIPTWFDPNTAGFTAFTSTNTFLSAIKDSSSYNLIFATGTAGNQIFYADTQAGIKWQPSTDTLTLGNGLGKVEAVVDGGAFV